MFKGKAGYSVAEVLIGLAVLTVVLTIASDGLVNVLGTSARFSSVSESEAESVQVLEVIKRDIMAAGFGLPHSFPDGFSVPLQGEVSTGVTVDCGAEVDATDFNDTGTSIPRAVVGSSGVCGNGSDYFVFKGVGLRQIVGAGRQVWGYVGSGGAVSQWNGMPDLNANDKVVVVGGGGEGVTVRRLIPYGGNSVLHPATGIEGVVPLGARAFYYSAGQSAVLNGYYDRVDYHLDFSTVSPRCPQGTGSLVRRMLLPDGTLSDGEVFLDCVATVKVVLDLDTDRDGRVDTSTDLSGTLTVSRLGLTAQQILPFLQSGIRLNESLSNVRLYVLLAKGKLDRKYRYPRESVFVGSDSDGIGVDFDLTTVPNYRFYRWQVYEIVSRINFS